MWAYAVCLTLSGVLAPPGAPPPYPDLSDPKAAAFSLVTALEEGDTKTVRAIYAGDDKSFLEFLDAFDKANESANRVQKAITSRFGERWAKTVDPGLKSGWQVQVGDKPDSKLPLTIAVASAEVKQQGDTATLKPGKDVEVRLKKTDAGWKVTAWPGVHPLAQLNLSMSENFCNQLAAEVEQGKYKKMYEVVAAAARIQAEQTAKLFKALSPKKDQAKDKK